MKKFDVIMATYNGEKFVKEQLDSILPQLGDSGRLIIHDDGSKDSTPEILLEYARTNPSVKIIDGPSQLSAKGNFAYLMSHSTAKYIFFADQDDIWHRDKVKIMLEYMEEQERMHGQDMPVLIHSDLALINSEGKQIAASMWKFQNLLSRGSNNFNRLASQNYVTGCAMLINRALLKISLPLPDGAIMHDWWIALVASADGVIEEIHSPLVMYRQHLNNEVGAKKFDIRYVFKRAIKIKEAKEDTEKLFDQMDNFIEAHPRSTKIVEAKNFLEMRNMTIIKRASVKIRRRFLKKGLIRNLAWLFI